MRSSTAAFAIAFSLAVGTSVTTAQVARAQSDDDRATARALGVEGQQALDAKSYATAEDRFRRADKLVHAPTLMLGLARSLAGEAKYVEAQETYNRIIREGLPPGAPDVFKKALEDAKKEVEAVQPKLGSVVITVKTANGQDIPDPKVSLDERQVNAASLGVKRAIDPGPHTLRVTADGYKPFELRFAVLEGGSATEAVTLEKDTSAVAAAPVPTPTPAPGATPGPGPQPAATQPGATPAAAEVSTSGGKKSVLPWVAFGIGGAGLLLGGITGIVAMGDHSSLKNNCPNGSCPDSQSGNLSGYHTMGTISTIGFVVAGVGAAAGVVLLLTLPKGESSDSAPPAGSPPPAAKGVRLYPVVGLGSAGVLGTF